MGECFANEIVQKGYEIEVKTTHFSYSASVHTTTVYMSSKAHGMLDQKPYRLHVCDMPVD